MCIPDVVELRDNKGHKGEDSRASLSATGSKGSSNWLGKLDFINERSC